MCVSSRSTSSRLNLTDTGIDRYAVLIQERKPDRGAIIGNVVLPFLQRDDDHPVLNLSDRLAKRQRDILFEWYALRDDVDIPH